MAELKKIVILKSDEDYQTIVNGGTLNYNGNIITYDENTEYRTPEPERYSKEQIDVLLQNIESRIPKVTRLI
jgi:hypothetical protein